MKLSILSIFLLFELFSLDASAVKIPYISMGCPIIDGVRINEPWCNPPNLRAGHDAPGSSQGGISGGGGFGVPWGSGFGPQIGLPMPVPSREGTRMRAELHAIRKWDYENQFFTLQTEGAANWGIHFKNEAESAIERVDWEKAYTLLEKAREALAKVAEGQAEVIKRNQGRIKRLDLVDRVNVAARTASDLLAQITVQLESVKASRDAATHAHCVAFANRFGSALMAKRAQRAEAARAAAAGCTSGSAQDQDSSQVPNPAPEAQPDTPGEPQTSPSTHSGDFREAEVDGQAGSIADAERVQGEIQTRNVQTRIDIDSSSSRMDHDSAEFLQGRLAESERLSGEALDMGRAGEKLSLVKAVYDFANDLSQATADAMRGVVDGSIAPFQSMADAMVAVYNNPRLLTNLSANIMTRITSSEFPGDVWQSFKGVAITLLVGDAYEKGHALGQFGADMALATLGAKVVPPGVYDGLKKSKLGHHVEAEIRKAPSFAAKVAEADVYARGVVDSAAHAGDKWSRTAKTLQDQMTFNAAQKGAGNPIIKNLGDSRFKGMEKWEYRVKSAEGKDSVVHYVRDPETGKLMDFKFTKHSTE